MYISFSELSLDKPHVLPSLSDCMCSASLSSSSEWSCAKQAPSRTYSGLRLTIEDLWLNKSANGTIDIPAHRREVKPEYENSCPGRFVKELPTVHASILNEVWVDHQYGHGLSKRQDFTYWISWVKIGILLEIWLQSHNSTTPDSVSVLFPCQRFMILLNMIAWHLSVCSITICWDSNFGAKCISVRTWSYHGNHLPQKLWIQSRMQQSWNAPKSFLSCQREPHCLSPVKAQSHPCSLLLCLFCKIYFYHPKLLHFGADAWGLKQVSSLHGEGRRYPMQLNLSTYLKRSTN